MIISLLAACGGVKVHEEVDKELAKDIVKVAGTIMTNYDKGIKREDGVMEEMVETINWHIKNGSEEIPAD